MKYERAYYKKGQCHKLLSLLYVILKKITYRSETWQNVFISLIKALSHFVLFIEGRFSLPWKWLAIGFIGIFWYIRIILLISTSQQKSWQPYSFSNNKIQIRVKPTKFKTFIQGMAENS